LQNFKQFTKKKGFNYVPKWKKCKKTCKKTHFGYIDALDLRFYSIGLKFEPKRPKESIN
jgi:hypothetical protein